MLGLLILGLAMAEFVGLVTTSRADLTVVLPCIFGGSVAIIVGLGFLRRRGA